MRKIKVRYYVRTTKHDEEMYGNDQFIIDIFTNTEGDTYIRYYLFLFKVYLESAFNKLIENIRHNI